MGLMKQNSGGGGGACRLSINKCIRIKGKFFKNR